MSYRIRSALIIFLISFFAATSFAAGTYDDGYQALQRGDYASALEIFRPLAEQGSVGAQYNLGVMYAEGHGVVIDNIEAFKWYHKAADRGAVVAEYNLAEMYASGKGTTKDYGEALQWFRKASDHGMAAAQLNLATFYARGIGTPINNVEAYKWASLASTRFPSSATEYRTMAAGLLDTLTQKMTPAQIAEARNLSAAWKIVPPPSDAARRLK